jgi:hypothetical protein
LGKNNKEQPPDEVALPSDSFSKKIDLRTFDSSYCNVHCNHFHVQLARAALSVSATLLIQRQKERESVSVNLNNRKPRTFRTSMYELRNLASL